MKTIRSFLALRLELNTVRAIADAQKDLKKSLKDSELKVAWVPPPNMHITIRFLGDVTEPMIYAIEDMLQPLISRVPALEVTASSFGVFPDLRQPRIIWAGVRSEANQLHTFYDNISKVLVEAGFPIEQRAFRSHLTIGRVKGGDPSALGDAIDQFREHSFGTTVIRDLICYRSDLKPHGAEYHKLWNIELAPPIRQRRSEAPGPNTSEAPSPNTSEAPSPNTSEAPGPNTSEAPGTVTPPSDSDQPAEAQSSNDSSSPTESNGEQSAANNDTNRRGE